MAITIRDIQGAAHISPLNGQAVTNVRGIVTAVLSNGFYIQDPLPDANDATSEGIFVFTNSAPTIFLGDDVLVSGTVSEFRPGGAASTNLTTTEIASPVISVQSTGNSLPAAVVIGVGGRTPPNMVIENDATGSPENSGVFDPAVDGIDFYESLEGMRVQVNNAVVVGPTVRVNAAPATLAEVVVVGDSGSQAGLRSSRGGVLARATDFNPERIIVTDTNPNLPDAKVGDEFNGAIIGVIDYTFGNFKLRTTTLVPSLTAPVLPKGSTTLAASAARLTLATLHLNNLTLADPQSKFDGLAGIIVNNLKSPSIICAEEVQDDNGPTNDSVVTSDATLNKLVAAITAAGGPGYNYRYINPVDDQDGGAPGGNSRQVFLFRPAIVTFVDRPGGTPTSGNTIIPGPQLQFSPGRIDPTNPAFNSSRKPLAGEFMFRGKRFFVIGNHFNSNAGDDPLFGRNQPPARPSDIQRYQGANIVSDFVESEILAADANADVVVAGRTNDFEFSDVMNRLEAALASLLGTTPLSEHYSYNFEGNSEIFHHILVSLNMLPRAAMEFVHTSADYPSTDRFNDHDPLVATILARPNTFAEWQSLNFTPTELMNTSVSGFAADPDVDGKPNGFEAALGAEPRLTGAGSAGPVRAIIVGSGTSGRAALGFDTPDIALDDVTMEVQESPSLAAGSFSTIATKVGSSGWTGSATVTVTPIAQDRVHIEVQSLQTLSAGKTFLRLKVSH